MCKNNPDPYLSYMKKNIRYSLLTAENDYLSNVKNDDDSDFDYTVSFVVTTFVNGTKATAYIPIITDYEPVMELLYNESIKNEAAQLKVKDILSNINDYIYKYDEISIYVSPARKINLTTMLFILPTQTKPSFMSIITAILPVLPMN